MTLLNRELTTEEAGALHPVIVANAVLSLGLGEGFKWAFRFFPNPDFVEPSGYDLMARFMSDVEVPDIGTSEDPDVRLAEFLKRNIVRLNVFRQVEEENGGFQTGSYVVTCSAELLAEIRDMLSAEVAITSSWASMSADDEVAELNRAFTPKDKPSSDDQLF